MRRIPLGVLTVACTLALSPGVAQAAIIDFTTLAAGNQGTTNVVLSNATVTSSEGNLFRGAGGIVNSICALSTNPNVGSCEADLTIVFSDLISNLTFETGGFNTGDSVSFFAYDNADVFLGSVLNVTANTAVNGLSGLAGIRRLFIDDSSTGAGYTYGNFEFTATAVPEPATLLLIASGLGAAAYRRRRKA